MRYQINKREYVNLITHCRNTAEACAGRRMELLDALEMTHGYWQGEAADMLRREFRIYLESGEYDSLIREYKRVADDMEGLLPEICFQMELQDRMSLMISESHKPELDELYLDADVQDEVMYEITKLDKNISSSVDDAVAAIEGISDILDLTCEITKLKGAQGELSSMISRYRQMAEENIHGTKRIDICLTELFDKSAMIENYADTDDGETDENLPVVNDTYWIIMELSDMYSNLTDEEKTALKEIDKRIKAQMPHLSIDERKEILIEIINSGMRAELKNIYWTNKFVPGIHDSILEDIVQRITGIRRYPTDVWLEDAADMGIEINGLYTQRDINRAVRLLYDNNIAFLDALLAFCEDKGDSKIQAEYKDRLELFAEIIKKADLLEADMDRGKTIYEAFINENIKTNILYKDFELGKIMYLPKPGEYIVVSFGCDCEEAIVKVADTNCWTIEYSIEGCNRIFGDSLCSKRLNNALDKYDYNEGEYDLLKFRLDEYDEPIYVGAMVENYANIGDIVKVTLDNSQFFFFLILDTKNNHHTSDELEESQIQCEYGHGYIADGKVQLSICEFIMSEKNNEKSATDAASGNFLSGRYIVRTEIVDHLDGIEE